MTAVIIAYAAVVEALATVVDERPIRGLHTAKLGDWNIVLNASREPVHHDGEEMSAWSAKVTNDRFVIVALLNPIEGAIAGISEAEFTAEMQALAAPITKGAA